MLGLRSILVFAVLLIICHQSTAGKHNDKLTEKELETLEEIEELLEEREKENALKKREDVKLLVKEAFGTCIEEFNRFRERQKQFKMEGLDGKPKRKRNRLFKRSKRSEEIQKIGHILNCAKKTLIKKTGRKTLKKLSDDLEIKKCWKETIKELADGNNLMKRYQSTRSKRTTPDECNEITDVNTYRTIDGKCNNLNNPHWGAAFEQQPRFISEVYDNSGVDTPRTSVIPGEDLPNPRELSNAVFASASETDVDESFNTLMSMNWGQFIDHDIVLTPQITGQDGAEISCCVDGNDPVERDECMAIAVDANDELGITCMEFVRSAPAAAFELGDGKQVTNGITSFIDGSMVYGSTTSQVAALRDAGGKLKVKEAANGNLLPEDSSEDSICSLSGDDSDDYCQLAGDVRVNVQPGLGSLHLVFMKEHNRIVDELKTRQPGWTDDKLFNEARKIIGAIIQHITYNEWLENVFVDDVLTKYDLGLLSTGFSDGYNDAVDPGITVGFATAALRFGHSQIRSQIAHMGADYSTLTDETNMEITLKNPHMLVDEAGSKVLELVRYMTTVQGAKADEQFSGAIRNKLFDTALDLTSLNIQRGRDHGLPSYTEWRKWCNLPAPVDNDDWSSMKYIKGRPRRLLQKMYKSVHDIDLYVGGMLELRSTALNGGGDFTYVGETFACILGEQFKNLKNGDRFWYERAEPEGFSESKLTEIRKVTLAGILCKNVQGLSEIHKRALINPANVNGGRKPCSNERNIKQMDFRAWEG
ncbi:peroxidasin homolog pxn-2-like [Mytilus californianus]|uniref:peroxidasin homolog pxn-2-like n=1 Tax=Mytilus californianus TaxID=6549 RepID=UPI00224870FB|nr:peroxidasin homolog pxn-2-like [Mytilus californianus]